MLVAIHQPNFFPWLGYFDKIARSDQFVVLDHVQLPRTGGGSWVNRVRLLVNGEPRWFTAPVQKASGLQSIAESRFHDGPWRRKSLAMLQSSYGRAPCFGETMALLEPLLGDGDDRVAEFNFRAVAGLAAALGIDTSKLVRSSTLVPEGQATELLLSIVHQVGGSAYLVGGGAAGYQHDSLFADAGIALCYQNFDHPTYSQHGNSGSFVPGLSVIDAMMNLGVAGTVSLLNQGQH